MSKEVAKKLLEIEAVFLKPEDPFTWASGIKSPIYCDNRLILTAPEAREIVEEEIAGKVKEVYPEAEVLMGTSTAGIAHAAIAGYKLGMPMGYVRGSSKDHGRKNAIEGRLEAGQKVVVIEDLVSTGGSAIDVVSTLREAGADVLGIVSIFTYGMKKSADAFERNEIKNVSLTNLDELCQEAAAGGYISESDISKILKFRDNPSDESWME